MCKGVLKGVLGVSEKIIGHRTMFCKWIYLVMFSLFSKETKIYQNQKGLQHQKRKTEKRNLVPTFSPTILQRPTVGQINQKPRCKYWAIRSSVRSHRSLVRLLRTNRFARALRCAHSLARSFTSLTPSLVGQ